MCIIHLNTDLIENIILEMSKEGINPFVLLCCFFVRGKKIQVIKCKCPQK